MEMFRTLIVLYPDTEIPGFHSAFRMDIVTDLKHKHLSSLLVKPSSMSSHLEGSRESERFQKKKIKAYW